MYVEEQLEFTGISGKTYTFKVYPKSVQLPETGGISIVTYYVTTNKPERIRQLMTEKPS